MTVDAILAIAQKYLKTAAAFGLMVLIVLIILKLLGFNVYPIQLAGYQETGILLAGIAYALK